MSDSLLLIILGSIAFLHSSVGLAGGTAYNSLFALVGLSQGVAISNALALNTMVSSVASVQFIRERLLKLSLIVPLLLGSMPMAYLGAKVTVPKLIWYGLLTFALLGMIIELIRREKRTISKTPLILNKPQSIHLVLLGAILGFISGAAGIGGGIFLAPILLLLGYATQQQAAALSIVFIWLNSAIGILSKWQSGLMDWHQIGPKLIVVGLAGILGGYLGSHYLSDVGLRRLRRVLLSVLSIAVLLMLQKLIALLGAL